MKKKPKYKKLQKQAEDLWKKVCFARDGRECQVKKYFPYLSIMHSNIFQVDHCISRKNKHTFLEVVNGTVVCSSCNMAKNNKIKSVSRAIDEIVKKREGLDVFERLVLQDQEMGPNHDWNKVWWLEDQIRILGEMYLIHTKGE